MTDAARAEKRTFDGLLVLDKPRGITSAKALYRVRKLTGVRKSGHAGTLDPLATGVLLICMGKATKLVERLMALPKQYHATARLDVTSASLDADSPLEPVSVESIPSQADLEAACAAWTGDVEQVPPAISALKVGGTPAYKLARSGKAPELAARRVRIDRITLQRYVWPEIDLVIDCGRGTYVRSLVRDLGAVCGVGGCLTALARTAVGPFTQAAGVSLAQLEIAEDPLSHAISLHELLLRLQKI